MSISTQQIQAVVRTYNKQLRLSGINKREGNLRHPCVKEQVALRQGDNKQHSSKQRRHRKRRVQ